jgi:mRNA-degrading endonuclease RelE of RelBE toxin-antitoxin system
MTSIRRSREALKQLMKIDAAFRVAIYKAVDGLDDFPKCRNVKALTNHSYQYKET